MIGIDLLRFSDRKIVLFDVECQRLNLLNDNLPFQLSYVISQHGKILERHNHYLKWPNFVMSPDAARITRFQQFWVDNGEDPRKVLEKWENYAMNESYLLCGHNALTFDLPVWQLWRRELGLKPDWSPAKRLIDTHLLSRAYKEGWKPDRANLLAWQYKVAGAYRKGVKTGLSLMAKELDIPVDENKLHDADYDLILNSALLWKLANLIEI